MLNLLRSLLEVRPFRGEGVSRKPRPAANRPARCRPTVEGLEDRTVPSVTSFGAEPLLTAGTGGHTAAAHHHHHHHHRHRHHRGHAASQGQNDVAFAMKEAEGNEKEVILGTIAMQRGFSQGTKDFGAVLATDHGKAEAQLDPILVAHGIVPQTGLTDPKDQATVTRFDSLSGRQFDRAFASYMVRDHEKDIKDYKDEVHKGHDASIQDYARAQLPVLRKHLRIARRLEHQGSGQGRSPGGSRR